MRRLLLAAAALAAFARPAAAGNSLYIDVGTQGSVSALAIVQDAGIGSTSNTVSGASGSNTPFTADGAWKTISINQSGGTNDLAGSIKTSDTGPGTNTFSANYSGGNNTHTIAVGSTYAPSSVSQTVAVTNTAPASHANTIAETLDTTGTLTNTLTVYGTNNSVTNTVAAGGNIALHQIIGDGATNGTASGNVVYNTASSLSGAFSATATVAGNGSTQGGTNSITNTATGTGDRSFMATLNGTSSTTLYAALNGGSGTTSESATVTTDSATQAKYGVASQATGISTVHTTLNSTVGGVYVQQTAGASSGQVTLTVNGGGHTLGTLESLPEGMTTTSLPANFFGSGNATPGIAVLQGSSTAISGIVTVTSAGYTVGITHLP
jgi:hypothetical protein